MKNYFLLCLLCPVFVFAQELNIIPKPAEVKVLPGNFVINPATIMVVQDQGDLPAAEFFRDYVKKYYSLDLRISREPRNENFIRLYTLKFIQPGVEGKYSLSSQAKGVEISGDTYTGTFYGVQTLIQLLPMKLDKSLLVRIPQCQINDQPRFSYRGLHLDVGRHLMPVEFLKKYIDYIALHKLNYFHWHLTEDQGWRIEIKKYPKLTTTGAWRNGTIIGRYPGKGSDNTPYGGYYTQEEVKEIVKYAADRHITVMPEIEMPGHSGAAIAAYPYLSCFPEQPTRIPANMISKASVQQQSDGRIKLVQETWGIFDDVFCAGKEETFKFLEGVLDEVIELFPSQFFHVGGDECPKTHWKKCPNCQRRMKENNLKDEHELQSYFIQRMEKYLNSKGRILVGWDEILEGGLAPNAIVMSWRGENGGIEAARQKHRVIMTPGNPVYFDHTQTRNEDSVTIGGYNPIEKVYAYEPIPAALSSEQGKFVLGAQANVWTEYMKNPAKVEYMIFPRLSALSEVLWTAKSKKNWENFQMRLVNQIRRYELWKANYSRAFFDVSMTVKPATGNKGLLLQFTKKEKAGVITYEQQGVHTQRTYKAPVQITRPGTIKVNYYSNNKLQSSITQEIHFNKATGKKITLKNKPAENYPGDGPFTLVNGIHNDKGLARSREFLGFLGEDCEALIDLGIMQTVRSVTIHSINQGLSWIYPPPSFEAFGSMDGKNFTSLGVTEEFNESKPGDGSMTVTNKANSRYRFIKVVVKNWGLIPDGKPGAGHKAWLFLDEIEVH